MIRLHVPEEDSIMSPKENSRGEVTFFLGFIFGLLCGVIICFISLEYDFEIFPDKMYDTLQELKCRLPHPSMKPVPMPDNV